MNRKPDRQASIASALRTVATEQAGLVMLSQALADGLAEPFADAVEAIAGIRGRVIVTGVGKSGHIGSKIRPFRFHRHAGLLRPPGRGEPRRSRHDYARRRHPGHVMVGRKRRTARHRRLFAPLRHSADRADLGRAFVADRKSVV